MKRSVITLLIIAVVLMMTFLISCTSPQTLTPPPASPPSEAAVEPPPLPAGDGGEQYRKAPDFEAIDSQGRSVKLADYIGKKNLVIVINRGFG